MDKETKSILEALDRLIDFGDDHTITPAIPRVTALYTQVGTVATGLRTYAGQQDGGNALVMSGAASRREVARELRVLMKPISEIARALDPEDHPGVEEKFRLPRDRRYESLISRGSAFVTALADASTKQLFTDRGLAATFDADLTAKVDEMVAITDIKNGGLARRIGATEGLVTLAHTGLKAMRELETILRNLYKDDPALRAALKSACHVVRPLKKDKDPAPQPTVATVAATTPADTPADAPNVAAAQPEAPQPATV